MSWFRCDLKCTSCETVLIDEMVRRSALEEGLKCDCGEGVLKQIFTTAPMTAKASYPDGHDRGDSWKKAKEELKIQKAINNTRPDKQGDLKKELKKVRKI